MSFKDQVTTDLATFFNVAEFADTLEVDGTAVACVLDEEDSQHVRDALRDGVAVRHATLRLRASDLTLPVVDQRMTIGERQADVISVNVLQGVLTIGLRWYLS